MVSTIGFFALGIPARLIAEIGNVIGKFAIGLGSGFRISRGKIWKMMNSFTPLRILNAHGNVSIPLINRPIMGDFITCEMCNGVKPN